MFREMRRIDKQMNEIETLNLLERADEGILGTMGDHGYPYTVVVNYVFFKDKIYIHSAQEGHKIDNIKQNNKVSFTVYDSVQIIPEKLNTLYESVTIFGKAKVIDATNDTLKALVRKYSDIDDQIINQMIDKEMHITAMIEIEIEHMTGKRGKQ